MSWIDYYNLLKKYEGDMTLASEKEKKLAAGDNPDEAIIEFRIAKQKYEHERREKTN